MEGAEDIGDEPQINEGKRQAESKKENTQRQAQGEIPASTKNSIEDRPYFAEPELPGSLEEFSFTQMSRSNIEKILSNPKNMGSCLNDYLNYYMEKGGEFDWESTFTYHSHYDSILGVVIMNDEKTLISLDMSGKMIITDFGNEFGTQKFIYLPGSNFYYLMKEDSKKERIALATYSEIFIYTIPAAQQTQLIKNEDQKNYDALFWGPRDESLFLCSKSLKLIHKYSLNGEILMTFEAPAKDMVTVFGLNLKLMKIAAAYEDHIRIWDLNDIPENFKEINTEAQIISTLVINPNSKEIEAYSNEYKLKIWDIETLAAKGDKALPDGLCLENTIGFSPSGRFSYYCKATELDLTFSLTDCETGAIVLSDIFNKTDQNYFSISGFYFTQEETIVACVLTNPWSFLTIYNIERKKKIYSNYDWNLVKQGSYIVSSLASSQIVFLGYPFCKVFDINSRDFKCTIKPESSSNYLCGSFLFRDPTKLILGDYNNKEIHVFDTQQLNEKKEAKLLKKISQLNDYPKLITIDSKDEYAYVHCCDVDSNISKWDIQSWTQLNIYQIGKSIQKMIISPLNDRLYTLLSDSIKIFNIKDTNALDLHKQFEHPSESYLYDMEVIYEENLIVTINNKSVIEAWDIEYFDPKGDFSSPLINFQNFVFSSKTQSLFVSGSESNGSKLLIIELAIERLQFIRKMNMKRGFYQGSNFFLNSEEESVIIVGNTVLDKFEQAKKGQVEFVWKSHKLTIRKMFALKDKSYLMTIGNDQLAHIWNLATGDWVLRAKLEVSNDDVFFYCEQNNWLLHCSSGNNISLYSLANPSQMRSLLTIKEFQANIIDAQILENNVLILAQQANVIKIFKIESSSGKVQSEILVEKSDGGSSEKFFTFFHGQNMCLVQSLDEKQKIIELFEINDKINSKFKIELPSEPLCISFGRTKGYLAIKFWDYGFFLQIWSARTNEKVAQITRDESKQIEDIEVTHSGQNENEFLAFGQEDELIAERDSENNIWIHTTVAKSTSLKLKNDGGQIFSAAFILDGSLLVSLAIDGTANIWSLKYYSVIGKLFVRQPVRLNSFCFPNSSICLGADSSGGLTEWSLNYDKLKLKGRVLSESHYEATKITSDKKYIVALSLKVPSSLTILHMNSLKQTGQVLIVPPLSKETPKIFFELSQDGKEFLLSDNGNKVTTHIIPKGDRKLEINLKSISCSSASCFHQGGFLPSGKIMLHARDKQARESFLLLFSRENGILISSRRILEDTCNLTLSPGGEIAVLVVNAELHVYDPEKLGIKYIIKSAENFSEESLFSFTSAFFAGIDLKHTIRVFDIENGAEIFQISNHLTKVSAIAFTPDEKCLLFMRGGELVKRNILNINQYLNLNRFVKHLRNIEVPEELVSAYTTQEFYSLMNFERVYPYNVNILNLLTRIGDVGCLGVLFQLCEIYNIYPSFAMDSEGKSALNIAIEKKNLTAIECLLNFLFLSTHKLHCCAPLTVNSLKQLFELGVPQTHQILNNRYLMPYGDIPMVPMDVGNVVTSTYESGFLTTNDFLNIFNLTQEKVNSSYSRLTYPEYRILDFPGILDPQNGFMELVSNLQLADPIFMSPALQAIIDFKWNQYARTSFLLEAAWNLLYMITYTANTIYLAPCRFSDEFDTKTWEQWGTCSKSMLVVSLVLFAFILIYLLREIHQIRSLGWRRYTRSFWNLIDISIVMLSLVTNFFVIAELYSFIDDKESMKALYSFSTFIVWGRMLDLFRGFRGTSFLIKIMTQTLIDIKFFIIVIFFLLVAFSFTAFSFQDSYAVSKWDSFKAFYNILVGDFGDFGNISTSVENLLWVVFLLMTLLMMIIMLNLLVAILGDSYDKIIGTELMTSSYERTKIIVNIEKNMSRDKKESISSKLRNCYLVVAYTVSIDAELDKSIEFNDRIRSKIEKIEKKVLVVEKLMKSGFEKINRNDKYFIDFVKKKFDKAFEKVAQL